jgi:para-aminobenzoate synthetase component I
LKREFRIYDINESFEPHARFTRWASAHFEHVSYLSSSGFNLDPYSQYDALLAAGSYKSFCADTDTPAFDTLKQFVNNNKDWIFGFFSYDLKNQLEKLESSHPDGIGMPLMHFFIPQIIFIFRNGKVEIGIIEDTPLAGTHDEILRDIHHFCPDVVKHSPALILHRTPRNEYIERVSRIKDHIQKGDIYEANYCIEFYSESATLDPVGTFLRFNKNNPAPFACYWRFEDRYLLSSSPERFLAKRGQRLISQPIKGTIKRGTTPEEDQILIQQLKSDPKERSENIMIVDLVRNDLAKTAVDGSVRVSELCGIYSYRFVHQMISTVESTLSDEHHFVDAIAQAFPMGSMTGAPKVRAMQIIEDFEMASRGLYSGAVGYITPGGDFDFNVIIRSILYNQSRGYISFMAGSAITIASDPEKEYDECLLKAASMARTISVFP